MLLLWLLIGEMIGITMIFMFAEMGERVGQTFHWTDLKDLIGLVLTPTITLVGTALGFYFGAKAEAAKRGT